MIKTFALALALGAFAAEVKSYEGPLYRQTSAHPEHHLLSRAGLRAQPAAQRAEPRSAPLPALFAPPGSSS